MFSWLFFSAAALSTPAAACEYEARPFGEQFAQARTAFIGTVETVENRGVYFRVEKALKNTEDGAVYATENGESSCHHRFRPGQTWLYLGDMQPAGSLLIGDEYGRMAEANAALAKGKYGYDYALSPSVVSGTIKDSCAPWDGAAAAIDLDNNLTVSVYAALDSFTGANRIVSFSTDVQQSGGASIALCEGPGKCRILEGTVAVSYGGGDTASGRIDVKDGEHTTSWVFRVKRVEGSALCG